MTLARETRHFESALLHLAMPFWGKPRIASLLRAMVKRVQELEDATWDVLEIFTIDNADTARLDVLGRIVGQPRFWSDDEVYRAVIRAKIRANRSRGLEDDIVEVIQLATSGPGPEAIRVYAPATMRVILTEQISNAAQTALEFLLPKTRSAGVQMHLSSPGATKLTWGSSRIGGGSNFGSSVSGGGAAAYSVRHL